MYFSHGVKFLSSNNNTFHFNCYCICEYISFLRDLVLSHEVGLHDVFFENYGSLTKIIKGLKWMNVYLPSHCLSKMFFYVWNFQRFNMFLTRGRRFNVINDQYAPICTSLCWNKTELFLCQHTSLNCKPLYEGDCKCDTAKENKIFFLVAHILKRC